MDIAEDGIDDIVDLDLQNARQLRPLMHLITYEPQATDTAVEI